MTSQIKRLPKFEQSVIAHEHSRAWFSCLQDCIETGKFFPKPLRKIILDGNVEHVVPSRLYHRLHEDFTLGKQVRENIYKEALDHSHFLVRDAIREEKMTVEQIKEVMARRED